LIPHGVLHTVLQLLHEYMGIIFLFQEADNILASLEKDHGVKKSARTDRSQVSFTISKMQFCISIRDFSELELVVTQPDNLSEQEVNYLTHYFVKKISVPPYSRDYLLNFIIILCLPFFVLKELIQIMRMEIEQATSTVVGMNLSLWIHERVHSKIQFLLRIRRRNEESGFIVPIKYTYAEGARKIEFLPTSPPNSTMFQDLKRVADSQLNQPISTVVEAVTKHLQIQDKSE